MFSNCTCTNKLSSHRHFSLDLCFSFPPFTLSLSLSLLRLSLFPFSAPPSLKQQDDEVGGTALRGQVEKLQVERNMLLETIEDLKQTVETATLHQSDSQVGSERVSERVSECEGGREKG